MDVKAESTKYLLYAYAIIGALLGLIIHPFAVFIGGMIGVFLGQLECNKEKEKVKRFNAFHLSQDNQ